MDQMAVRGGGVRVLAAGTRMSGAALARTEVTEAGGSSRPRTGPGPWRATSGWRPSSSRAAPAASTSAGTRTYRWRPRGHTCPGPSSPSRRWSSRQSSRQSRVPSFDVLKLIFPLYFCQFSATWPLTKRRYAPGAGQHRAGALHGPHPRPEELYPRDPGAARPDGLRPDRLRQDRRLPPPRPQQDPRGRARRGRRQLRGQLRVREEEADASSAGAGTHQGTGHTGQGDILAMETNGIKNGHDAFKICLHNLIEV